ncbi:hypothetical protein EXIGLDRAFT_426311 [Exidia glandulosa HHB12029]|uniref:Uncharacterized protein n=1 Tax=Exidia glandulosa HHB12029 TaxID=1314781 RepID=A0A165BCQ8_EXIGL|nr:hypothetical protein EXIGLDRAFT_426311 [Exidia glandulosa HHB12029]
MHASTFIRVVLLALATSAAAQTATVDASTLAGKLVYGYQGWFRRPGETPSNNIHWSTDGNAPNADTIRIDIQTWPDVSQFPPECLFDTGLTFPRSCTFRPATGS